MKFASLISTFFFCAVVAVSTFGDHPKRLKSTMMKSEVGNPTASAMRTETRPRKLVPPRSRVHYYRQVVAELANLIRPVLRTAQWSEIALSYKDGELELEGTVGNAALKNAIVEALRKDKRVRRITCKLAIDPTPRKCRHFDLNVAFYLPFFSLWRLSGISPFPGIP